MRSKDEHITQLEKEVAELKIKLVERELFDLQKEWTYKRIKTEQRKLDTLLNCLPNGVNIISQDYKIQFQNKWIQDRFGSKQGKICYQEYMRSNVPCSECPVVQIFKGKKQECTAVIEVSGRQYEMVAAPFGEFNGQQAAVEIVVDLTEEKQVQETLADSQTKYAHLVSNLNVGIWQVTPGTEGKFLEVNPALVSMLEADTRQHLVSFPVSKFYPVTK